jgi:FkbM family methyltransferase
MQLTFQSVVEKYDPKITGIIHIGAHYGNEVDSYIQQNVPKVVFFEPLQSNFSILESNIQKYSDRVIAHKVALGNTNGRAIMNISSNDAQSSSILNPKVHLQAHPEVSFNGTEEVELKKLDDYQYSDYNFMVIDVQGYELEVLKGSIETLKNIDYLYCEVNQDEVYEGNALIGDIDSFLSEYSFKRVETEWWHTQVWGNALYIKQKMDLKEKFKNFPVTYYVSLIESENRREILHKAFEKCGIKKVRPILSPKFYDSNDIFTGKYLSEMDGGTIGCAISHLKALKHFYYETDEPYAFFCEDDVLFDTAEYWNFTWEEFMNSLPDDWECVQLMFVRKYIEGGIGLRKRYWDDWGATAYIMKREHAKKIIDAYCIKDTYNLHIKYVDMTPLVENIVFTYPGKNYTLPIFTENTKEINSTFTPPDFSNTEEIIQGQKHGHYFSNEYLLNWWKENGHKVNLEELCKLP